MKPTKTTHPSLLDEPVTPALLISAALLIGGVYLVNLSP
jgi:drug/metabolite transporter (DMT)-like permease